MFLKLCFRTLPSMWQPTMPQLKTRDTDLKPGLGLCLNHRTTFSLHSSRILQIALVYSRGGSFFPILLCYSIAWGNRDSNCSFQVPTGVLDFVAGSSTKM